MGLIFSKAHCRAVCFLVFLAINYNICLANEPISLLDLQNLKVYSASKKEELVQESASAVYVLTGEEIRRSGSTTIMDALRLVPGMNVAQPSNNKWAISSRGFNDRFANKLLVLVDGRSVYTHQFAGVYWESIDFLLDDIDRVEVIRGPGAALWGANAVNGVINIMTKNAKYTQKDLLSAAHGNHNHFIGEAREAGKIGDNSFYRAYAKNHTRSEMVDLAENGLNNDWFLSKAGFRIDSEENSTKHSLIGDAYYSELDFELQLPNPAGRIDIDETGNLSGGSLLFKWEEEESADLSNKFQTSLDFARRSFSNIDNKIFSFDADFQQNRTLNDRNELIWGAGFRGIRDDLVGSASLVNISYNPTINTEKVFSAFAQNQFAVIPDELTLTLGSKFEHNDYTGFEVQPNVRLTWTPDLDNTVWASVSRAVRVPSRSEEDLFLVVAATPGGFITWNGSDNYKSEELIAYELGYKTKPLDNMLLDLALFYNDYDDIRTFELGATNPGDVASYYVNAQAQASSYGLEALLDYQILPEWRLVTTYTYLDLAVTLNPGSTDAFTKADEGKSPKHQATIRSHYNLGESWEVDNMLYFTDHLDITGVDSNLRFDSRIAYIHSDDIELSIVGQNLLDPYHQEFSQSVNESPSQIGRAFYFKTKIKF